VIYVDDGLLSHEIVLPLFENFYYGIELLFVGKVLLRGPKSL
jgi:hypothetical protein